MLSDNAYPASAITCFPLGNNRINVLAKLRVVENWLIDGKYRAQIIETDTTVGVNNNLIINLSIHFSTIPPLKIIRVLNCKKWPINSKQALWIAANVFKTFTSLFPFGWPLRKIDVNGFQGRNNNLYQLPHESIWWLFADSKHCIRRINLTEYVRN